MIFISSKVVSRFNNHEHFDFRKVPTSFKTVPMSNIRRLHRYCLANNKKNYKNDFEPSALKNMLQSVSGLFNHAYMQVDADYTSRMNNLVEAYEEGLADTAAQISRLEAAIDEHNNAYAEYADAYEAISGRRPNKNLIFGEDKLEKLKASYDAIEQSKEAKK